MRRTNPSSVIKQTRSNYSPLQNTTTNKAAKKTSTLMSYSVFQQHHHQHYHHLDSNHNNNNSNEELMIELTRKSKFMQEQLSFIQEEKPSTSFSLLLSSCLPHRLRNSRLLSFTSFLFNSGRKQRAAFVRERDENNSHHHHHHNNQIDHQRIHTIQQNSNNNSSNNSMCGFLNCQFIRSAAVMQFCLVLASQQHQRHDRQGNHIAANKITAKQNPEFELSSNNNNNTTLTANATMNNNKNSSFTHKAALQIAHMIARIEGWGNHNNNNNHHQQVTSSSSSVLIDDTIFSNRASSEFMKSCGKPRVKIGKTMQIRSHHHHHSRHQDRALKMERKNRKFERDTITTTNTSIPSREKQTQQREETIMKEEEETSSSNTNEAMSTVFIPSNSQKQQLHSENNNSSTTTIAASFITSRQKSNNINNNPNTNKALSHLYSTATSSTANFIEARRNLFRPSTSHNISTSMMNPPVVQIISKEASISNFNAETVVYHPPQMSPVLAARVESKTRELEKVFMNVTRQHQQNQNQNEKQNNNNKKQEMMMIASWTTALRTWLTDTGKYATLLRNHDDSLSGFNLALSIARLGGGTNNVNNTHFQSSLVSSMNEKSSSDDVKTLNPLIDHDRLYHRNSTKQVDTLLQSYNETRRRPAAVAFVKDSNSIKSFPSSSSSSSSSSSLDVAVITRHAWFASIYCGLWREALAVGAPPLLVASALSGGSSTNNNTASSSSSMSSFDDLRYATHTNTNHTKAACSAYLMSFQQYMMKKKNQQQSMKENATSASSKAQNLITTKEKLQALANNNNTESKNIQFNNNGGGSSSITRRRNNHHMSEVVSSSSLGCYLAMQSVKQQTKAYDSIHNVNNNNKTFESSSSTSSDTTWYEALKIVKALSYRGHLVNPNFHIRLSNTLVYGEGFEKKGLSLTKMNNNHDKAETENSVNSHHHDQKHQLGKRHAPAATILQHVCCDSTNAMKAWSFARTMSSVSSSNEPKSSSENSPDLKTMESFATRFVSMTKPHQQQDKDEESTKALKTEEDIKEAKTATIADEELLQDFEEPKTLRQTVSLAHRLMKQGKSREAYARLIENEETTLPPTKSKQPQNSNNSQMRQQPVFALGQSNGGGKVVRERLVAAIAAARRREKERNSL